jgi:aryl-alcohol dehydrogenase-like predicted oxidoreductase
MMKITIPNSETAICRLGFGCARMAGGTNARRDWRLLESARSLGITHFDTAPAYGSEALVGDVFGSDSGVTITTKVGIPRADAKRTVQSQIFLTAYRATVRPALSRVPWLKRRILRSLARHPVAAAPIAMHRLSKSVLLEDLDRSLKLLKRARIDLYLLHEPESLEIAEEIPEVLAELKRDGVIGAYGTAFGGPARGTIAVGSVEQCRYDSIHRGNPNVGATRIYHGVLRNRVDESDHRSRGTTAAGEILSEVLIREPGCAVIFSASSAHQIREMDQVFSRVLSAQQ